MDRMRVTPPHQLGILRRWFPLLLLGVLVPSVLIYLLTSIQPQVYQVSATLLPAQLRLAGNPAYETVAMSRLVGMATNYAYTAKSHELLSSVGQQLQLTQGLEELTKQVDATVDENAAVLTITARAGSAPAAAALANAVAKAVEEQSAATQTDASVAADAAAVRARMLETQAEYQRLLAIPPPRTAKDTQALETALTLLQQLTTVYDSLSASVNKTPDGLIVEDQADLRFAQQIAPRTLYFTLLAAIAGLLLAIGLASILEYLDDSMKSPEDVQDVTELATLGTVAPAKGERDGNDIHQLGALLHPRSGIAEAYRTIRTSIEFASVDEPIRTLLITSAGPGEGKTITAANLAVVFAQAGRRVLLVDADLRQPGVHVAFDLPNAHGLTTLLRSDDVSFDAIVHETAQANLRVLTTGPLPPNPAELLGTHRMRTILDRLKTVGDLVIFDSPPLEGVTDSAILSSFIDGTVLVISAGHSRRAAVRLGCESLARAHANMLGAVLFGAARRGMFRGYRDDSRASDRSAVASRAAERANPT
jgi:non-specific protein-tyrosine kinase